MDRAFQATIRLGSQELDTTEANIPGCNLRLQYISCVVQHAYSLFHTEGLTLLIFPLFFLPPSLAQLVATSLFSVSVRLFLFYVIFSSLCVF